MASGFGVHWAEGVDGLGYGAFHLWARRRQRRPGWPAVVTQVVESGLEAPYAVGGSNQPGHFKEGELARAGGGMVAGSKGFVNSHASLRQGAGQGQDSPVGAQAEGRIKGRGAACKDSELLGGFTQDAAELGKVAEAVFDPYDVLVLGKG